MTQCNIAAVWRSIAVVQHNATTLRVARAG